MCPVASNDDKGPDFRSGHRFLKRPWPKPGYSPKSVYQRGHFDFQTQHLIRYINDVQP